ncbi:hypothetical protein C8R45DRAFT_1104469 [Mycena sanguinolenta]|nr:hypothetical protein C8R45DRAFT_1104469 [Mycena sanguinolenta]
MSGSPSQIDILPTDVLHRLLELVVGDASPLGRVDVMLVCRAWRDIIKGVPACSRKISFRFTLWDMWDIELAQSQLRRLLLGCRSSLRRARSASIDLKISIPHPIPPSPIPGIGLAGQLQPTPQLSLEQTVMDEAKALISEVAPRTRSLYVEGVPTVLVYILSVPWPRLPALGVHVEVDPSPFLAGIPSLVAPLLCNIFSSFWMDPLADRIARGRGITTVELFARHKPIFQAASLDIFLEVLTIFPQLQQLTMAVDDIVVPLPPSSSPLIALSLRRLYLTSSRPPAHNAVHKPWRTSKLWSYFTAPCLNELSVPQRWFEIGPIYDLNKFFHRNGRVPVALEFVECAWDVEDRWIKASRKAWPDCILQVQLMPLTLTRDYLAW